MNNINKIVETIINDEDILTKTINSLINQKEYELAKELLNKSNKKPISILKYIILVPDIHAFRMFKDIYVSELYEQYYEENYYEEDYDREFPVRHIDCSVGEMLLKLFNILNEDFEPFFTEKDNDFVEEVKCWIKKNYIKLVCPKCKSVLTDENEAGIYTQGNICFQFNEGNSSFEDDEVYSHSEKYYCGNCDRDVTELVEEYI